MGFFDIVNDPLSLAAERAALCLFLRGDLAPLEAEEPLVLDPAALCDPATGAPLSFEAPPPSDFAAILAALRAR